MYTLLPFFAVVKVSGDDRDAFLHNQLSNDINGLKENQLCCATYNTPKGRVIANMLVYKRSDAIYLALAADLAEAVVKRLKMFVLRAKVQFELTNDWGVAAVNVPETPCVSRPDAPMLSFDADEKGQFTLPHGGTMQMAQQSELPAYDETAAKAWQLHEIQSGFPWISAATTETCVAQMLDQHRLGGVHFRKGCYPGQEIIARAQYRGQVKRGLVVVSCQNAPLRAGDAVYHQQEDVGLVINSIENKALLVIKHGTAKQTLHDSSGQTLPIERIFFETTEQA